MTDDKFPVDNDDWLDDFDEDINNLEMPAELDQASLDELFGDMASKPAPAGIAGGAQAAADPGVGDDEDFSQLDQSSIDALLGGDGSSAPKAAAGPVGGGEDYSQIDQSSIDALLGGGDVSPKAAASAPAAEEDYGQIDQSSIDALLGGSDDSPTAASSAPAAGEDYSQIDQSSIDALLGGVDVPDKKVTPLASSAAGGNTGENTAGESKEVDPLYTEVEEPTENRDFTSNTVSFSEVMADDRTPNGNDDEPWGFDVDDFDLDDDIPNIPSGSENSMAQAATPPASTTDYRNESTGISSAIPGLMADTVREAPVPKKGLGHFTLMGRKVSAVAAGIVALSLLLVMGVGGSWYYTKRQNNQTVPAIVLPPQGPASQQTAVQPPVSGAKPPVQVASGPVPAAVPGAQVSQGTQAGVEPARPANNPPLANSARYLMQNPGESVAILLVGNDQDGDPLTYQVSTMPKHGRISGAPPDMAYLPDKDFPGDDRFEFVVNDGKENSLPAIVQVSGPGLIEQPVQQAKVIAPKRPVIEARNVQLEGISTEEKVINWQEIWEQANDEPYDESVKVEVMAEGLHGRLEKINNSAYRYIPDPYWSGREELKYRFKVGKNGSKLRTVDLEVAQGEPPPDIRVSEMQQRKYAVGETVILDASKTLDDNRETLVFQWEQLDGAQVYMVPMNREGSIISFIMPSSFYTVGYPEPVIRVSVRDSSGQVVAEEIKIPVDEESRRVAANWSGLRASKAYHDAYCPKGYCPDNLLPWALEE